MKIKLAAVVLAMAFMSSCATEESEIPSNSADTVIETVKNKAGNLVLGYLDDNEVFQEISDDEFKTHVLESLDVNPAEVSYWEDKSFHYDTEAEIEYVKINWIFRID